MNIMSRATSLPERIKVPGEIVHAIREIAARTSVLSEICLELAKTRGVKVTSQTVRKYIGQHGR
jgi:sulfur relay (sulfurtransferase) complex TusBCD TusD component (DsrE family)